MEGVGLVKNLLAFDFPPQLKQIIIQISMIQ